MDLTTIVIRLGLAIGLGGLVGIERENKSRPAGFRTHILVCVGSALVMITADYIFEQYGSLTTVDPARLGAQVISGIGFLGAGTIIRYRESVVGLTTAASLWAVACVGIAAGIGFYEGAIAGGLAIFLSLIVLRKLGKLLTRNKVSNLSISVNLKNKPGCIGNITSVLEENHVRIKDIRFPDPDTPEEDDDITITFKLKLPPGMYADTIIRETKKIVGVYTVEELTGPRLI